MLFVQAIDRSTVKKLIATFFFIAFLAFDLFLLPVQSAYADVRADSEAGIKYINKMAAKANMEPNDFVVSVVVSTNVTTGINGTKSSGVSTGKSLEDNLDALIDTNDYPSWDSLTEDEKLTWGAGTPSVDAKSRYLAFKFCDGWMPGYDFSDAGNYAPGTSWEQFKQFEASGGGNWEWENKPFGEKLAEMGPKLLDLINGNGTTVQDLLGLTNQNNPNWFADNVGYVDRVMIGNSNVDGWPSGFPDIVVYRGDTLFDSSTNGYNFAHQTDRSVYCALFSTGGTISKYLNFDLSGFSYRRIQLAVYGDLSSITANGNWNVANKTAGNYTYRITSIQYLKDASMIKNNFSIDDTVVAQMLGAIGSSGIDYPEIESVQDYPADIQQDLSVKIKVPSGGVNNRTTWNQYIVNSGGGSGSDDEPVDLSGIISLLEQFKFDRDSHLLVNDPKLHETVQTISDDLLTIIQKINQLIGSVDGIKLLLDRWFAIDTAEAIGDFDFSLFKQKVDALIPDLKGLMPFGAIWFYKSTFDVIAAAGSVSSPVFHFDFNFLPGHPETFDIDLSFLDGARAIFNFVSLLLLTFSLIGLTMKFVVSEVK